MLFRPSFCANCGERIERAEWNLLTSRRFCEVCAIELKQHDWYPRMAAAAVLLFGLMGLSGYLFTSAIDSPKQRASLVPPRPVAQLREAETEKPPETSRPVAESEKARTVVRAPTSGEVRRVAEEPVAYCGAETRKGTPCSRRVKRNTRCYQHAGMPSMPAAERNKIQRN
jgi:hypothetical protein